MDGVIMEPTDNNIEMSYEDGCDLAAKILGMSDNEDNSEIWGYLEGEYEIEPENFMKLVRKLIPLIEVGKSSFTGTVSKGFAERLGDTDVLVWFAKMEIEGVKK